MDPAIRLPLLGTQTMNARWTSGAGLIGAPTAWAISTQLSQMLPHVDCASRLPWSLSAAAAAILAALTSAGISWVGRSAPQTETRRFMGYVSVLVALAISFALALQAVATLVIDACDR